MKTQLFRIPVSRWSDEPSAQALTGSEHDLLAVKIGGKTEDYYLLPVGARLTASKRLVALLPAGDFDEREFAMKVGRLGQWGRKEVLLVGLASDAQEDSRLRRHAATIGAYLRAARTHVDFTLVSFGRWQAALGALLRSDDRVVCLENHSLNRRWNGADSLAQNIAAALDIPVCVLQGIALEVEEARVWTGLRELLVWVSILLTLFFFILLQIRTEQAGLGALGIVFQIILVVIELLAVLRLSSIR